MPRMRRRLIVGEKLPRRHPQACCYLFVGRNPIISAKNRAYLVRGGGDTARKTSYPNIKKMVL